MKERYDSEKKLKNAFDSYQMPFDEAAFDKFKTDLDKEEKKKSFIWWLLYGKIIVPIVVIGLIAYLSIYNPLSNDKNQISSANIETTNSFNEINTKSNDFVLNEPQQTTEAASAVSETNSIQSTKLSSAVTKDPITTNAELNTFESQIDKSLTSSNTVQNKASNLLDDKRNSDDSGSPVNDDTLDGEQSVSNRVYPNELQDENSNFGNNNTVLLEDRSLEQYSTPQVPGIIENDEAIMINDRDESIRSEIVGLKLLDLMSPDFLKSQKKIRLLRLKKGVVPYKEKFKKYFYFNLGGGFTVEDNYGPFNEVFSIRKTNEPFWRASVAYQINPTTSFQLSYMQKNASIGFEMKDFVYRERYAKNIAFIKLNMINSVWTINSDVNLNMTNGISLLLAPSHINDFADSKNTYRSAPFSNTITNINSEWNGLHEGTHLLYSGGLNMDIKLSRQLELNIGAEYTIGTKSLMSADLNYIEGEGIIRKLQAKSNSSFASASVGLKYILKGK